jgi:predicted permease
MTLLWCDLVIRLAAPVVPHDLRRDWLREWRAEIAFAAARAAKRGRRTPRSLIVRACGAPCHAVWLRWDRWRTEMIWQDLKHALRSLRAKPGFTAVTALTLAIGIGGNAAIFGAVNAVLLRPLPYPDPDRIVQLFKTTVKQPDRVGGTTSPPDFADWRRDNDVFSEMGGYVEGSYALTGEGAAEQLPGASVTGGFFDVMGTPALHGRAMTLDDAAVGGPDVTVLSYAVWTRRFGADPRIVGRRILLDGISYEVIGVMPSGFNYPLQAEVWLPLRFTAKDLETQRGAHYVDVVARLKSDTTLEQARAKMQTVASRLATQYPSTNRDTTASVHQLKEAVVGSVRQSMFVLLGAVGLVLVIVCVNVAGLLLVRGIGRSRELAVRVAIGAGRASLLRGLLVESLVLGLLGGVGGLVLAAWAMSLIASLDTSIGIPMLNQTRLDATVVAFTLGISLVAAIVFGTMPAWQATSIGDVARRIREEGGSTTSDPSRQRLRSGLIVAETVLAVVLLVGAGLLSRSFARLLSVELGLDSSRVQTFSLTLPEAKYSQPVQRAGFVSGLLERIAARPDVESAGAVFGLPLTNFRYGISTSTIDGVRLSDEEQDRLTLQVRIVTPDYFRALGITVARGRGITAGDRMGAELVAVLNETAAARLFPSTEAVGHHLTLGTRMGQGGPPAGGTIVGIVRDVREHGPAAPVRPTIYLAHQQFPVDFVSMVIRARGEPATLVEPMRALMAETDPDLPMFRVRTMDQIAGIAVAQPRLYTVLIGCFALTALLLSAIGLYGVLAYAVGQRTREIGIRLALGAGRGEVLRMVMAQAGTLAISGIAAGLLAAIFVSQFLRSQLFEIAPTDVATYVMVAVGLLLVSLLASFIPARRAARINPITALRQD